MRSWVGLFKTLHIVTPQIAEILSPFESSTAGKESKEDFVWNYDLEKKFREAKENINKLITLYLPSPQDQLIMETDAAKGGGKNNLPAGVTSYTLSKMIKSYLLEFILSNYQISVRNGAHVR